MNQQRYTISPYNKDSYKSYVIGTAVVQAFFGALPGAAIGFVLYIALRAFVVDYSVWAMIPDELWQYCLVFAGFTGGLWGMWNAYIESHKWDQFNRRENEITPFDAQETAVVVEDSDPLRKREIWVDFGGGNSQVFATIDMTNAQVLRFQSWLMAIAMNRESNITRDHAITSYSVKRTAWESWRDLMRENNCAVFDDTSTPYIVGNAGRVMCHYIASRIK